MITKNPFYCLPFFQKYLTFEVADHKAKVSLSNIQFHICSHPSTLPYSLLEPYYKIIVKRLRDSLSSFEAWDIAMIKSTQQKFNFIWARDESQCYLLQNYQCLQVNLLYTRGFYS